MGGVAVLNALQLALAAHRHGEAAAAFLVGPQQAHSVVEAQGLGIQLFEQDR
jgi:hypothetical protein